MKRYEVIFFDLDGTLLDIDAGNMIQSYFRYLREFLGRKGFDDPPAFADFVGKATRTMGTSGPERLNGEVFWEDFGARSGMGRDELEELMEEFYRTDFNRIGADIEPIPAAVNAVELLYRKGYRLFLTTMPLFPLTGIHQRLRWAGIDPAYFSRITTFENSYSVKPEADYYLHNIEEAGVEPHEVLVVGNHTVEDLAPTSLGCDAFLVTDNLLDGIGVIDYRHVMQGSIDDFLAFARSLPPCEG